MKRIKYRFAFLAVLLVLASGWSGVVQAGEGRTYIEPVPFKGTLTLVADEKASPFDNDRMERTTRQDRRGVPLDRSISLPILILDAAEEPDVLRAAIEERQARRFEGEIWSVTGASTRVVPPSPSRLSWSDCLSRLKGCTSEKQVWIRSLPIEVLEDADKIRALSNELMRLLKSGGSVVLQGGLAQKAGVDSGTTRAINLGLLEETEVVLSSVPTESKSTNRIRFELSPAGIVQFAGRDVRNLSANVSVKFQLAATEQYNESIQRTLPPQSMTDFTAWRRALAERQESFQPRGDIKRPVLKNGSLVIVGGGGATEDIWKKFVELAGGEKSRIIILPTAVPDPVATAPEATALARAGAANVKVLPQIQRDEMSSESFLKELREATGVWFGGGRQWRFVDAYWATPAWSEIQNVVNRGGVIGGSSAGATIQGDLLVRGSPLGNQIMICDGYRSGLGLLPGVAIDQHFTQRNRFDDLLGCLKPYPATFGIGIDESTALVVEAPDRATVLGKGSVWMLPPVETAETARSYQQFKTGSELKLEDLLPIRK